MIFASVVLAVFLAWPFLFGGRTGALIGETADRARAVAKVAMEPRAETKLMTASIAPVEKSMPKRPESCYQHYQRIVAACPSTAASACRLGAADQWDLCEATGFWPD